MGQELVEGCSGRMAYTQGVRGGNELSAVPQTYGGGEGESVEKEGYKTRYPAPKHDGVGMVARTMGRGGHGRGLPVDDRFVEDVLAQFGDDFAHQAVFHSREVLCGIVVAIA